MSTDINNQMDSYLTFKLEDETFAVSVSKVLEIQEIRQITKVPRTPNYMRGVLNLRGSVLPVIDTRIKFGMTKTMDSVNTCILVLTIEMDSEKLTIGALVDAVQEVIDLKEQDINPPPSIGSKYKSEFIKGMGKLGDNFVMILDIDKVFSLDELLIVKETSNETFA